MVHHSQELYPLHWLWQKLNWSTKDTITCIKFHFDFLGLYVPNLIHVSILDTLHIFISLQNTMPYHKLHVKVKKKINVGLHVLTTFFAMSLTQCSSYSTLYYIKLSSYLHLSSKKWKSCILQTTIKKHK